MKYVLIAFLFFIPLANAASQSVLSTSATPTVINMTATPTAAQYQAAADGIIAAQMQWIAIAAAIEQQRRAGKIAVAAAATAVAAQAAQAAAITALQAL